MMRDLDTCPRCGQRVLKITGWREPGRDECAKYSVTCRCCQTETCAPSREEAERLWNHESLLSSRLPCSLCDDRALICKKTHIGIRLTCATCGVGEHDSDAWIAAAWDVLNSRPHPPGFPGQPARLWREFLAERGYRWDEMTRRQRREARMQYRDLRDFKRISPSGETYIGENIYE